MQSKFIRYFFVALIAVILLTGAFSGGVAVGWAMPGSVSDVLPLTGEGAQAATPAGPQADTTEDRESLFAPFWAAWDIVHEQYVDQPVDDTELMRGAIRGMMEALGDPHSSYMDPNEFEQANAPLVGEYEGIGAWVDVSGDYLKIVSPMPGSPAEEADLRPNDEVIAIDGEDMTGIDGDLVLRRILGPAGTEVTLTILRSGEDPEDAETFDVVIERAKIVLKAAEGRMLEQNIAYVQVNTYGDKTTQELRQTLRDLMSQDPVGMILDLRNNGGGYLHTAIEVVSEFVPGGQVAMYEEFSDGSRRTFKTTNGGLATDIPLVVLVNGGSASAAEITAGAIQDLDRGQLVGETTYGKGSVQNWASLGEDQGAVRVTVARWLTPDGRQIHEVGLTPDVVVELTEEDLEAERDPQLDRAVELLSQP